jgi:regulator of sigma E protease
MLFENPAMQSLGFKTGDKILAADGTQSLNLITTHQCMKVIMAKMLIGRTKSARIAMPIDLVDQLSKYEKGSLIGIRMPFVVVLLKGSQTLI